MSDGREGEHSIASMHEKRIRWISTLSTILVCLEQQDDDPEKEKRKTNSQTNLPSSVTSKWTGLSTKRCNAPAMRSKGGSATVHGTDESTEHAILVKNLILKTSFQGVKSQKMYLPRPLGGERRRRGPVRL